MQIEDNSVMLKSLVSKNNSAEKGEGRKKMNKKLLASTVLLLMLTSTVIAIKPTFAVTPNGGILHFVPDPVALVGAPVGYEEWIKVTIDNINPAGPGIGGIQVKVVTSDTSIVKFVAARLPTGHFMDPDGSAEAEGNLWKVTPPKVSADGSTAECATTFYDMNLAIAHGDAPIYASGVIMEVKIMVMAEPPKYGVLSATFSFDPAGTVIGDTAGQELERDISDTGAYTNTWAPPAQLPHLEVWSPDKGTRDVVLTAEGQEFDLNIIIKNVAAAWELVGLNFKLNYNSTMLQIVSVSNGTFFENWAGPPNGGMFYIGPVFGPDYIIVGVMILPDENGTYHGPFPEGEGVVYTIRFKGILQGVYPTTYTCPLDLDDSWVDFGDKDGVSIPKDPSVDGTYTMKPRVLGRTIDVYTQYSEPYGGQGINATSDMFWPQQEVILYANVTYNEWPVQNKDVTFQVIAPDGTTMTTLVGRTNEYGVATASFRMNWPCDSPEDLFGEWTVIASVDIAGEVVRDFLWFKYDYLVRIWKVTTDKDSYAHGEWINVTVTIGSQSQIPRQVVVTITIHDELNFPVITGTKYFEVTVSGAKYCSYNNYTGWVLIHVDKSVVAGTAKIHVNALSNWPTNGGYALTNEYSPTPEISILAKWA